MRIRIHAYTYTYISDVHSVYKLCTVCVYMYTQCLHVCKVSTDYSGPLFREGGPFTPFPNIVSSRLQHANSVYNLQVVSTCGAQCLQTILR